MQDNEQKVIDLDGLAYYNNHIQGQVGNLWTRVNEIDDRMQWRIQYNEMPEADENYEDQIVQYFGTTDNTYTNGYFYKCVGDYTQGEPIFSWEQTDVQPSSGGSAKYVINVTGKPNLFSNQDTPANRLVYQAIYDNYSNIRSDDVMFLLTCTDGTTYKLPVLLSKLTVSEYDYLIIESMFYTSDGYTGSYGVDYTQNTAGGVSVQFLNGELHSLYGTGPGIIYGLRDSYSILGIHNTTAFTPTGDYNPATKLYADSTSKLTLYSQSGLSEYSSSSTYVVGDYVYYNMSIYKCNTAITVAEAWDSTHWTSKTYLEYLQDTLVGNALNQSY